MGAVLSLRIGGACVPRVFSSETPVYLSTRTQESEDTTRTSTRVFIESRVPSLLLPFRQAWWLSGCVVIQPTNRVLGDLMLIPPAVISRLHTR